MTDSIAKRIDRVEKQIDDSAGCDACGPRGCAVYHDNEPEPPERCAKCGRPLVRIHLRYINCLEKKIGAFL